MILLVNEEPPGVIGFSKWASQNYVGTIDLIHNSRHVGFAFIMQISYTLLKGQTTQVREVIMNILATQVICFSFIECLSPE